MSARQWFIVAVVGVLAMVPSVASGQEAGVLSLVTEEVISEQGVKRGFWWQQASGHEWTGTDVALRAQLVSAGVRWEEPAAGVSVSKVYRVGDLSMRNAAALAGVLGSKGKVLVGKVVYERVQGLGVAPAGWRARVDVELMEASWRPGEESLRLTLERVSYGEELGALRQEVGRGLGTLVSQWVKRSEGMLAGEVGGAPVVVLRGVGRGQVLDELVRAMRGVEGVEDVVVRWAASGMIALELRSSRVDRAQLVEYVARVLVAQESWSWRLSRAAQQPAAGAVMLDVVEGQGSF
jgi:hypothetical protein